MGQTFTEHHATMGNRAASTLTREVPRIAPYPLPGAEMLTGNRVDWPIDPRRAALFIHDAQNYWIRRFEDPSPMIGNIVRMRSAARRAGIPTIFSGGRYGDTPEMRGLAYDMWGPGIGGYSGSRPDDAAIIPELVMDERDLYIEKARYSAFFQTGLEQRLAEMGIDQLIMCGIYCHHGCLLTAADAYMRDIKVFFVIDGSADHSRAYHDMALSIMADLCAKNVLTDQVCAVLDAAT